jgi:DNA-binding transcriptional MerR regulator
MLTTGQIAQRAALSEKAVRLYADRGLLTADRDANNHRVFAYDQVERARRIALLRSLDLSLVEVRSIIDSEDAPRAFDRLWDARRSGAAHAEDVGAYARSVLADTPPLPGNLHVLSRDLPSRAVLCIRGEARLSEIASVLPTLTGRLLNALTDAGAPLAGPLYVEFYSRVTGTFAAELRVCAPFAGEAIRAVAGMEIAIDSAHTERFVGLRQGEADDQSLVVAVHDYLSGNHGSFRLGPNREIYYPSYGTGIEGEVMDVAITIPTTTAVPQVNGVAGGIEATQ